MRSLYDANPLFRLPSIADFAYLSPVGWLYRNFVRPALFCWDSEEIHNYTLEGLAWMSRHAVLRELAADICVPPELPTHLWGLRFPNPVGLAAGMDKQATAAPIWPSLGFGFSELGGVTQHPQSGNPPPRMFRAPSDEALVNRMGFNNPGCDAVARTLTAWKNSGRWPSHPVGMNLGKSKITSLEQAGEDYLASFQALWGLADFFVVNVSSPNTPNLRQLQDKAALGDILSLLQSRNQQFSAASKPSAAPKPILVKVAPDLTLDALDEILELVEPCSLAGLVATNTTLARPPSDDPAMRKVYSEAGGLSGSPLRHRSTEVIRHLHRQSKGRIPIIGVGGIFHPDHAWEKIVAGASLVQVYSGLVYEGPTLVKKIVTGLHERLQERGMRSISEAVGSDQ